MPNLRENQRPRLQLGGRNPNPCQGGSTWHQLPAGRPRPHAGSRRSPECSQEGGTGRREPPRPLCLHVSQMTRGGKFTGRGAVAFCWVSLTPLRRRPSPGSPSSPAQTTRRLPLHLKTRKPGLGHLRRRVPLGIGPLPSRRPAAAPRLQAPYSPLVAGASSRAPYWAVRLPGARCIQAAAGDTLPGLCCIPPAWESKPASARRGRGRVCVCACVCAREYVCECVRACVGRG